MYAPGAAGGRTRCPRPQHVEIAPYDGIVRDLLAARIVEFELSGVHEDVSVRQFAELT